LTHSVTVLPNGKWKQNCYVVSNDATGLALLIDPGSDAPMIQQQLSHHTITPVAILNTHGHFDHIGAVAALMAHYKIPFYLNPADSKLVKQANLYKFLFESKDCIVIPEPSQELLPQDAKLQVGGFEVSILFTPGHTKGSTCLHIDNDLFSGDTLLPNGPGRTDLPGGDKDALAQSVELLRKLPDASMVWPGHGRSFNLGSLWEKLAQSGVPN
jgi:glyoxylase-like metal-dependent hydrolase (beta-lactamase superfamily II)